MFSKSTLAEFYEGFERPLISELLVRPQMRERTPTRNGTPIGLPKKIKKNTIFRADGLKKASLSFEGELFLF
ncbi:hypothetical protein JL36_08460 [Lactococcus cremoris]|nr:hypothetical protein JL36_08460 [Lactococcus cremoris]